MSDQKIDMALAFLQSQPDSAAAVLEQQPAESAAEFLRKVPHYYAAPVLRRMLPKYIARVSEHLEPAVAAGFLSEMDTNFVVSILRLSDEDMKNSILELLPERTKLACKLLLRFSEELVGAWMATNIMTLPLDCTAQEACSRLASGQDFIDADAVHVVDREGKLQGVVAVTGLLRANPETPIVAIMRENPESISGRAALVSAADHPVWAHSDTVAVINRNQQIVGILRHVDLRRGLDKISNTIAGPSGTDPLLGILEVYGESLLALLGTVFDHGKARRPGATGPGATGPSATGPGAKRPGYKRPGAQRLATKRPQGDAR